MKNKKKEKLFNVRVLVNEETGTVKIMRAEQHINLNQHRGIWKVATSREVARLINRNKLVIK